MPGCLNPDCDILSATIQLFLIKPRPLPARLLVVFLHEHFIGVRLSQPRNGASRHKTNAEKAESEQLEPSGNRAQLHELSLVRTGQLEALLEPLHCISITLDNDEFVKPQGGSGKQAWHHKQETEKHRRKIENERGSGKAQCGR